VFHGATGGDRRGGGTALVRRLAAPRPWDCTNSCRACQDGGLPRRLDDGRPADVWRRERDIRNDFHLPAGIRPANFLDLERTEVAPIEQMTAMQDPSVTWADLAGFIGESPLPVIAKGVLRPDDALRAVEAGVAAIYVSNHGGRQLDSAVPSLD